MTGPIDPVSESGYRYAVHFTCMATRYCFVYFMQTKDEIQAVFEEFLLDIRAMGYTVERMTVRHDNAREYVFGQFRVMCRNKGIVQETSSPYMHEDNSIAEVIWRDTEGSSKAMMLTAAEFPREFWPLAFRHAVFVRNRMPHTSLGYRIPYTLVTQSVFDMSVLRVFGSPAYSWIDSSNRKKLDDKAIRTLYVGHKEYSSQYILLDLDKRKLVYSGKPVIDEQFTQLGKRISSLTLRDSSVIAFEHGYHEKPTPFVSSLSELTGSITLSLHSVWYTVEDHETVAVVQVTCAQHHGGVWLTLRSFLETSVDPGKAYEELTRYLTKYHSRGTPNFYYPLFVRAMCRPPRCRGALEVYVVSADTTESTMYGVFHRPNERVDGYMDVPQSAVVFEAVGVATVARAVPQDPLSSQYVEPRTYVQAKSYPDWPKWSDAVDAEMDSLAANHVLEFGALPEGAYALNTKFVFKLKRDADGAIDKYKARLVVQGFAQQEGVDYDETFAPVAQLVSLRVLLVLSLKFNLNLHHLDVKTAFLNSPLSHVIWVRLPAGFANAEGYIYAMLLRSLYGLKQAARDWYLLSDDFILGFDSRFRRSLVDPCLYYIWECDLHVLVLVHVDDYVVGCDCDEFYDRFREAFGKRFAITDLGSLSHVLQMKVEHGDRCIYLSQSKHIQAMLDQFNLSDATPVMSPMEHGLDLRRAEHPDFTTPFRSLGGTMLWVARCTRPDIYFSLIYLLQFSMFCTVLHYNHLKRVARYLLGTVDFRLKLSVPHDAPAGVAIDVYCDSDWASDKNDRKSYTGALVLLCDNPVSWVSRKQATVSTSSCEAEYIANSEAAKEGLHVYNLVNEILEVQTPMQVHLDNVGAMYVAQNSVNNSRTKHIDIRYHMVRDWVAKGFFKLMHVPSVDNVADVFTKALPVPALRRFAAKLLDYAGSKMSAAP